MEVNQGRDGFHFITFCDFFIDIAVEAVNRLADFFRKLFNHRAQAAAVSAPRCAETENDIALCDNLINVFCSCNWLYHNFLLLPERELAFVL